MERTTITISKRTKQLLETIKGDKDWDEFLFDIYKILRMQRKLKALKELRKLITDEDLKELESIIETVKVKWSFRELS